MFNNLKSFVSIVCFAMLISLNGGNIICMATSDLIFHSGFEDGSTGVYSDSDPRTIKDIVGTDNSVINNNNWENNLDGYSNGNGTSYGSFTVQNNTNNIAPTGQPVNNTEDYHSRYANIVDDPTNTMFEDTFEDAYDVGNELHYSLGDKGRRNWSTVSNTKNTMFSDNFDANYTIGQSPHWALDDKGTTNWSAYSTTNTTINVQADPANATNKAMKILSTTSNSNINYLEKKLDATASKKIYLSYKVYSNSKNTYLNIGFGNDLKTLIQTSGTYLFAGSAYKAIATDAWIAISLEVDFENNCYSATVNNVRMITNEPLYVATKTDLSNISIKFSSSLTGLNSYYFLMM